MTIADLVTAPDDCHSHNTERLDIAGVKALLVSLPEMRSELESWNGARV